MCGKQLFGMLMRNCKRTVKEMALVVFMIFQLGSLKDSVYLFLPFFFLLAPYVITLFLLANG